MVPMAAPRARAVPDPVTKSGSAATVLDFAVGQILQDDTALGALPAVLGRLVSTFGLRAAVAFQPAPEPTVLAMSPGDAVDEALLARIGTLTASSPGVLLARSVPVGGQCLCALALIGDGDVRAGTTRCGPPRTRWRRSWRPRSGTPTTSPGSSARTRRWPTRPSGSTT